PRFRFLRTLLFALTLTLSIGTTAAMGAPLAKQTTDDAGAIIGFEKRRATAAKDASEGFQENRQNKIENSKKSSSTPKTPAGRGTAGPKKTSHQTTPKSPKYEVSYSTTCAFELGGSGTCRTFDEAPCPEDEPLKVRTIRTPAGALVSRDTYCSTEPPPEAPKDSAEKPADLQRAVQEQRSIEVSPADFQSFPIRGSKVASQPSGFSLRNGNAHMYAKSDLQTFDVDIYDEPVRIRAIPQTYLWNYGDGHSRKLQKPGKPMPGHTFDQPTDTSHVYTKTGDYSIQLNTAYRGEYSVDGGPWMPIPGTATVPSDPMPMSVWRTKKLLVDEDCAENPGGPACDSPFLNGETASK
ncbi:MAG: hypothetical protein L0H32_11275, partial [Micrococcaceae bacterium]|nr:hypothetical protein [Micrococcaceae bacterium]